MSNKASIAKTQYPLFKLWEGGLVPYTFHTNITDSELENIESMALNLN